MRKILALFLAVSAFFCVCAQENKDAIGIRLGLVQGLTYQHHTTKSISFEGVLSMYRYDPALILFAQYHIPEFLGSEQLSMMFGLGSHAMYVKGYKNSTWYPDYSDQQLSHFVAGVDAQLGLNYYFTEFPLNLCLEFRPAFNLLNHSGLLQGVALSARYRF